MKLQLEFNTNTPDESGNIFSESVLDEIINNAENVPVLLGDNLLPLGVITSARRNGKGVEFEARLDKERPETEFFEKGHIVYSISCRYQNMEFVQTGNERVITSARLGSVVIEPGQRIPPVTTIFTIE